MKRSSVTRTLALSVRDPLSRLGLAAAAERAGLVVRALSDDPASVVAAAVPGTAFRAPGGLVAAALRAGPDIRLAGPTPAWFVQLGADITGRTWTLADPAQARQVLASGPAFVKLADAKRRELPARRYASPAEIDAAMAHLGGRDVQLLVTTTWLSIESEYRVFTEGRQARCASPYRVEDEPWTPLLHTHRGSLHHRAREHVAAFLESLAEDRVPPAAALDVARLTDGRFILLEANQSWSAGLYGCDPDLVPQAVLAANAAGATGRDGRWLWRPDPALG